MRSIFSFIVKPIGNRYNNTKDIGNKKLVINTSIESFKHVNNIAEVVETPLFFESNIKKGDLVVIHHNVFRVFYDIRGNKKNSRSYLFNDLFICDLEQIYLYKNNGVWKTVGNRCFIKPIKENSDLNIDKEQKLIGILKYGNSSLEELGVNEGDVVGYKPYGEFDFIIDEERMYCMQTSDIVLKYDSSDDYLEYNPNWVCNNKN